jgi:hypothetical protein
MKGAGRPKPSAIFAPQEDRVPGTALFPGDRAAAPPRR